VTDGPSSALEGVGDAIRTVEAKNRGAGEVKAEVLDRMAGVPETVAAKAEVLDRMAGVPETVAAKAEVLDRMAGAPETVAAKAEVLDDMETPAVSDEADVAADLGIVNGNAMLPYIQYG